MSILKFNLLIELMFNFSKENDDLMLLLNSGKCQIEDILDFEDIVSNFRSDSPHLFKFFTNEQVAKLIKYITQLPKETDNDKKKFKFPFIACEILSSENKEICDMFFASKPEEPPKTNPNLSILQNVVESPIIKNNDSQFNISFENYPIPNEFINKKSESSEISQQEIENEGKIINSQGVKPIQINIDSINENSKVNNEGMLQETLFSPSTKTEEVLKMIGSMNEIQNGSQSIVAPEVFGEVEPYHDLKELLFSFLKTDEELNSVLSGYFEKAICCLLSKNYKNLMRYIFKTEYIHRLIYHIDESSISAIVYKILSVENYESSENYNFMEPTINDSSSSQSKEKDQVEFDEYRIMMIKLLVAELMRTKNYYSGIFISKTLIKAIENKVMIQVFNSKEVIDLLYDSCQNNNYFLFVPSISILIAIFRNLDSSPVDNAIKYILSKSCQYISTFKDLLFNQNYESKAVFEHPSLFKLGSAGLSTMMHIDWIYQLQLMDSKTINEKMGENKYALYYLFLFPTFFMNTNLLSKMCNSYINCLSCISEKVLDYFIIQCDIGKQLQYLILNKNLQFTGSLKFYNKPYTVFIIKIAHMVNECSYNEKVKKYLQESIEWQSFYSKEFTSINEIYSKSIAGGANKFKNPTQIISGLGKKALSEMPQEKDKKTEDIEESINFSPENLKLKISKHKAAFQNKKASPVIYQDSGIKDNCTNSNVMTDNANNNEMTPLNQSNKEPFEIKIKDNPPA